MRQPTMWFKRTWRRYKLAVWKATAEFYVRAATMEAKRYLRSVGPIKVLVDSSVLGHGTTHRSVWISTGQKLWGDTVPTSTGYAARVPVYATSDESRTYRETCFLVGIAELAQVGLIKLVTSPELQAEKLRHPLGRFAGYNFNDHNVFDGLDIHSVEPFDFNPWEFDRNDPLRVQVARLNASTEQPFSKLASLLSAKHNLDAWHLHTAHKHKLFCFLAIDFPLSKSLGELEKRKDFPKLDSKMMLPSDLAAKIKLRPIPTYLISYRDAKFIVHPELHALPKPDKNPKTNEPQRTSDREMTKPNSASGVIELPRVARMQGASVGPGLDEVIIQYTDDKGIWHQLGMKLPDAMYLLSLLKSIQLKCDIPFPDDPSDPNSKPIRPSDARKSQ